MVWDHRVARSNRAIRTIFEKLRWVKGKPNVAMRKPLVKSLWHVGSNPARGFSIQYAGMLKLVDIAVSDAAAERRGGSSPLTRTIYEEFHAVVAEFGIRTGFRCQALRVRAPPTAPFFLISA